MDPNTTSTCQTFPLSFNDWVGIGAGFLVTLTTVILNALVLLSILFVSSLRKPHNLLLFSLAISDFLVGIIVMPMLIYMKVFCDHWPMGGLLCDIWISLDVICCGASIFNMTAIAIDRYIATTSPLKYRVHASSAKAIILGICAWIAAAITTIPQVFAFGNQHNVPDNPSVARCQTSDSPLSKVLGTIIGFYIPLLTTIFAYGKVMSVIAEKKKNNAKNRACSSSEMTSGTGRTLVSIETSPNNEASTTRQDARHSGNESQCWKLTTFIRALYNEHKGTAILGSLLVSFILCWGPFFTIMFVESLWRLTGTHDFLIADGLLADCILWFGYINSTLNPFILCFLFKDFRRAFREILFCRCLQIPQTMRQVAYTHQVQTAAKSEVHV